MAYKKIFGVKCFIFFFVFFFFEAGFSQTHPDDSIVFSGNIRKISKDYQSITVNEKNCLIAPDTKIVDQKGNVLKIHELKPDQDVAIDATHDSKGWSIKRIVIIRDRGV